MSAKINSRIRRAKKTRFKLKSLGETRLTIFRTPRHIYAQVIAPEGDKILAAASTVEKELRGSATGNSEAATKVGQLIAERAKALGVSRVAFDRSGFKYHGRVKALAEAAREAGLEF